MIEDYLSMTVEIKRAPRKDRYGEDATPAFAETGVLTHYKTSSRRVTTAAGELVVANGMFTFHPSVRIALEDRIVAAGREYKPVEMTRPVTLDGEASLRVWVV